MKRLLVISNSGMSNALSNGRTLRQLLMGYDSSCLAQFFLNGEVDEGVADRTYKVSDKMALQALLPQCFPKKKSGSREESKSNHSRGDVKRNCRNLVIRDWIWSTYRWWDKHFQTWLTDFAPEVIVFQAGDCPFMYEIAYKIAKMFHIPVVVYNSESYVLRDKLYHGVDESDVWHKILKRRLKRKFLKLMQVASFSVYINEELEDAYKKFLGIEERSVALRTSSGAEHYDYQPQTGRFCASYCGNLGGGRDALLLQFSEVLERVDKTAKMIVCGGATTSEAFSALIQRQNVEYLGSVPYETVQKIMQTSDLLVHCEGTERIKARYYAFSTKIADCLMCGIPFLVYTSREYPFARYLERNNAAFVGEAREELEGMLRKIVEDPEYRCQHLGNAYRIAMENHNPDKNAKHFQEIIEVVK